MGRPVEFGRVGSLVHLAPPEGAYLSHMAVPYIG